MKRRNFLQSILPMALTPLALNGIPVRAMGRSFLTSSFTCDDINDRVLVLIQLHGGNDGLNTIIPVEQYSIYKNLRPLIGIKDNGPRRYIDLDTTLPVQDQVGLHPDLVGIKDLYDDGQVHVVQDVSYPFNNGSHFRGTDIWLSGKDGDNMPENPESGWWGRYLDHYYEDFPQNYPNPDMEDPPGLEFGSHIISLGFHRQVGIPMGLTLSNDPSDFGTLVSGVGGALPTEFPISDYGSELEYLVQMETSTNVYAQRLADLYAMGTNSLNVTYPETYHTAGGRPWYNRLSPQLKTVARLLSGGSKTKVFLVRMSGFDTHAEQALAGKPSFGNHGALLYHLSGAIKAFQDDLKELGLADRVLTVTFSEFGRQVAENSTQGTDHGSSAPMLLFGRGIKPGLSGTNPDLTNLSNNSFATYQHDYRQVFTTILQDWLGANNGTLNEVEFYQFASQKLDLVNDQYDDGMGNTINYVADTSCDETDDLPPPPPVSVDLPSVASFRAFPNPIDKQVQVELEWLRLEPAEVRIINLQAQLIHRQEWRLRSGLNQMRVELPDLAAGTYVLQVVLNPGSTVQQKVVATEKLIKL